MNEQVCYICHDDDHLVRSECRCRNCYYHYECAQLLTGEDKEHCPLCKEMDINRPFYNPLDLSYVRSAVIGYGELFMFFVIEDFISYLNVLLQRMIKIIQRMAGPGPGPGACPGATGTETLYVEGIYTVVYMASIGWTLWFRCHRFRQDMRFLYAIGMHSLLMILQELMITLKLCERIDKTTLQCMACLMCFCIEIAMRATRIMKLYK